VRSEIGPRLKQAYCRRLHGMPDRYIVVATRSHELAVRFALSCGLLGEKLVVGDADAVGPVWLKMCVRISFAIADADERPRKSSVTSRYASSSESGSISGV
jgi:hypothetical protein